MRSQSMSATLAAALLTTSCSSKHAAKVDESPGSTGELICAINESPSVFAEKTLRLKAAFLADGHTFAHFESANCKSGRQILTLGNKGADTGDDTFVDFFDSIRKQCVKEIGNPSCLVKADVDADVFIGRGQDNVLRGVIRHVYAYRIVVVR